MALIKIDSKTLNMQVNVGVKEEYTPDEEILEIYNKVEDLKKKTNDTVLQLCKTEDANEAASIIDADKVVKEEWVKFLDNTYKVELLAILELVKEKNKKICPGYEAHIQDK